MRKPKPRDTEVLDQGHTATYAFQVCVCVFVFVSQKNRKLPLSVTRKHQNWGNSKYDEKASLIIVRKIRKECSTLF